MYSFLENSDARDSRFWERVVLTTLLTFFSIDADKLLWWDEVGQFVFGAYDSLTDAVWAFFSTIRTHHGQTGASYFLNYMSLKAVGAGLHSMRWPSYVSGFLLFWSAHDLATSQTKSLWARLLVCLSVFTFSSLTHYISESRAYIMLAASSLGVLAYYLRSPEERKLRSVTALGWVSVLWGVLHQPFFSVYWVTASFLGLWVASSARSWSWSPAHLLWYFNWRLCLVGTALYFILGRLTWMGHSQPFDFDPYQFTPQATLWSVFFDSHFTFLRHGRLGLEWRTMIGLVVLVLSALIAVTRMSYTESLRKKLFPFLLACAGFALSYLLVRIVIHRHYWIIDRQWIGSFAWVACATALAFWSLYERFHSRFWRVLAAALLVVYFIKPVTRQLRTSAQHWAKPQKMLALPKRDSPLMDKPQTPEEWVLAANQNCAEGKSVWPVFKKLYGEPPSIRGN